MCGIIGYTGFDRAADILLFAIKKLENRGYDSAGMVLLGNEEQKTICRKVLKGEGVAIPLRKSEDWAQHNHSQGIGHTRWATHGDATEVNAHPHQSDDIWVVHNGQIENYRKLKLLLKERGYVFVGDTDSEVVPHLIHYYRAQGESITSAIKKAFLELVGARGLVIGVEGDDCIYAITQRSPLVIGFAEHGHFVASHPLAFPEEVTSYSEVPEHVLITLSPSRISHEPLRDRANKSNDLTKLTRDPEADEEFEKDGYAHYMLKEIMKQPDSILATLKGRLKDGKLSLNGIEYKEGLLQALLTADQITLIACGTSYFAACVGAMLIERFLGIRCRAEIGSEYELKSPVVSNRDVVIGVSQSGETADTIAGLKHARSKGAKILGICNNSGSAMVRLTEAGILLHAGPEMAVASTKAFTSQVVAFYLLTMLLAKHQGKELDWASAVEYLPRQIARLLDRHANFRADEYLATKDHVFVIGRELDYPVAQEVALKIKEVSYVHAEGFAAGEMKHGTYALIEEGTPCIIFMANLSEALRAKMLNQLGQIKSRGVYAIVLHTVGDTECAAYADVSIEMEPTAPELRIIANTIVGQLIAYKVALKLGRDIDMPRNLAKTVTVE